MTEAMWTLIGLATGVAACGVIMVLTIWIDGMIDP
jgi:hypothetical protein